MKTVQEQLRRLSLEYGFKLSEEEIENLARRAEEFEQLFHPLYEIDLTDTPPLLKLDRRS